MLKKSYQLVPLFFIVLVILTAAPACLSAGETGAVKPVLEKNGLAQSQTSLQKYDLLILNGTIIDGTGSARFQADIGIKNGKIKEIGDLEKEKAGYIIDATGLVVAPGFIESHCNDRPEVLIANPYALSMTHQGVTSLVMGEQGFAPQPTDPNAPYANLDEGFEVLMKNGIAVNFGSYVDQNDARIVAMGYQMGEPTAAQLEEMKAVVVDGMNRGAFGLSSALVYPPGSFSSSETVIELAKVAAAYGGTYKTHVRGEDEHTLEDGKGIREAIDIGKAAGIPVVINHMKSCGFAAYQLGIMEQVIDTVNQCRAAGQVVSAQIYPYSYGIIYLSTFLPPWRTEGGKEVFVALLKDPAVRAEIRKEIYAEIPTPYFFNFVMTTAGGNWEKIKLTSVVVTEQNTPYVGKNFYEIAAMLGYDIIANPKDAIEACFDLIISEYSDPRTSDTSGGLQATVIVPAYYSMDDMCLGLKQDWVSITCDGFTQKPEDPGIHPRCFGSFPRVLGQYCRDENLFSLEDAVRKMTGLTAWQLGLKNRGIISKGFAADITIFNPLTVKDMASYENPNIYPAGIEAVIVNGVPVIENGEITGARPGQILRFNKQ